MDHRRVFKFAQYENRAHNFFAVDRVPANAKWGTDKHVNELTLKDKPIYVWIVGAVATCRLYDHEKQAHPANVSIEIDPVSSTVLAKAKHFLGRVCNSTHYRFFEVCDCFKLTYICHSAFC